MKFIQLNLSTPDAHEETPAISVQPRQPQTFIAALIACAEDQTGKQPEPPLDPFVAALDRLAAEAVAECEPAAVMQDSADESLAETEPAALAMQDAVSASIAECEPVLVAIEDAEVEAPAAFKPVSVRWQEFATEGSGKVKMLMTARWQEVAAQEFPVVEEPVAVVAEPVAAVTEPIVAVSEPIVAVEKPLAIVETPLTIVEAPLSEESLVAEDPVAVKPAALETPTPAAPAAVFVPPPAQKPNAFMRAISWLNGRALCNTKQLRVIESVSLGEKRFVAVVHVEGRKFLIGGGASAVSLLTQLGEESGVASLTSANLAESLQ
jgi:hypothetical protein